MYEPILSEPLMRAFHEQLSKEADALQHILRAGTRNAIGAGVGSGLGLGLGAGALIGAGKSGHEAYTAARERGQGVASSAVSALGGGAGGALRGAARGAVIGAGAGALAGAALPGQTIRATRGLSKLDNVAGSLSNFGQRQVHSVTGWKPGGAASSVERIGAGAAEARKARDAARAGGGAALEQAERALGSAEKTQRMGLTSLPGLAKSVNSNGLLPTLGAGMRGAWDSSGTKGKALMVGLPALSAASALATPEGEGGPGRGERLGRVIGGTVGGMAAPLSLTGGLLLGAASERAGGVVGRGVDRLRGKRPGVPQEITRPVASEPGDVAVGQQAVERVYGTGFTGGQE